MYSIFRLQEYNIRKEGRNEHVEVQSLDGREPYHTERDYGTSGFIWHFCE
jgi:hypothetical protein